MKMDSANSVSWKTLAEQKEKEWREILESRIEALEKECKEKDNQLVSERAKFQELKEHFKYNLKLLEERDSELEKYDISYSELRTALNLKTAEISELNICIDDLKNVVKREEENREHLQVNYQKRLKEKQAEVDAYKSSKDGELQDERKEYEQFRRNLQLQLLNVQNELNTQKSELSTQFENELKKREHEFRLQCDELHTKALEHELKAKLLEKELELTRESTDKTVAAAEEAETTQRQLEKLVKQKEWELTDVTAVKDSQLAELQNKLTSCESGMKKMQEDFQRKYTEMDKLARDKESVLERAKNGYLEKEQALQSVIQELQSKLEDAQIRERQLTWSNQDLIKEKEMMIEKLQEEINDVKEKWNRHITEISRENVTRDLDLSSALEEQRRLKLELEQRKEDIQRYKNELKLAAEREEKLDKAKAQTELDWQRRCEDLERQQYDKSEDLIKKLITARNEAQALVKERERELHHKILLLKSLHRERDQMRALLKKHNIPLNNFVSYSLDKSGEGEEEDEEMNYVEDLQKQNASLKELIAQMRSQMESLGEDGHMGDVASNRKSFSLHEIEELRKENRELKTKLKSSKKATSGMSHSAVVQDNEEILSQVENNAPVKSHIIALNSTIGTLRSEKVELAATAKKQQARIAFLENSLEETSKLPRQKQIQIDQLKYELSSCRHHHETQVAGLRNRVSELELQLVEARREADEYHRASLERNEELVVLGNQLSALKLELSESNPTINFGAQELYIQQLQDEIAQLRKRAAALDVSELNHISSKFASLGDSVSSADLRHKLKSAATKIIQLAKENQQLTESNNRLRAELTAAVSESKRTHPVACLKPQSGDNQRSDGDTKLTGDSKFSEAQDRLQQLEKLQYQLTRQELQFAQRFQAGHGDVPLKSTGSIYEDIPERDTSAFRKRDRKLVSNSQIDDLDIGGVRIPTAHTSLNDRDPELLISFSSGGGDSIQKVWQMLEESSPSVVQSSARSARSILPGHHKSSTGQEPETQHIRPDGGDSFYLQGQPVPTEVRSRKDQNARKPSIDYTEKIKKQTKPKSKIRNYNVRDDPSRR